MSEAEHTIFSAIGFKTVVTATARDNVFTITADEDAVLILLELGVQIAAETLLFLLEEPDIQNHRGEGLAEFLGAPHETELRNILSRISDPDGLTFTTC